MPAPARARLALAVLLALAASACQAYIARFMLPREGIRKPCCGVRIERRVELVTPDGVALRADVYHPETAEPAPTILVRIPLTASFTNDLGADAVGRFWASRGYTVVIQGTRGRHHSDGAFYPLRPERADGIATLRWLAAQPWFDGRLGMWGGSAFGHTQWAVADQSEPGPQALMIQIASTDFYAMFHPGGAFSLESALYWAARSHGPRDVVAPDPDDLARGYAGFPLLEADDRAVGDVDFFDDWASHTERDSYWREIDGDDRAARARAPVLLMAGWYDPFLPGQLRDFQELVRSSDPRVARETRLVVGPWSHAVALSFPDGTSAEPYRPASLAPSIAWFDHVLRGQPLPPSLDARVRIYVLGENVWREEREWPLARTRYTDLYLATGGRLADAPAPGASADRYVYDPANPVPSRGGAVLGQGAGIAQQNDVEARPDVLVYSGEPLAADLELTGPLRAVLWVSTSAPCTDFTVKLVDVWPDGAAYNVSEGILRRRYAPDPDGAAPSEIAVELWPTSTLFRAGHRLRVEVASSSYPRFDRNPNTGREIATERAPVTATQRVWSGARFPSRLTLPVIPR